ncbi:hypothetical protein EVG20_g11285 [Dentipellis fragilis]|uniref:Uncharacterized protein n=1 Tax=Dentipellis fragilis TaxID=205917 RepID=A0A4Y9XNC5_9AGAM|nr:hypothetical protein EVG20_g11285 [Dentipellis fragilis]
MQPMITFHKSENEAQVYDETRNRRPRTWQTRKESEVNESESESESKSESNETTVQIKTRTESKRIDTTRRDEQPNDPTPHPTSHLPLFPSIPSPFPSIPNPLPSTLYPLPSTLYPLPLALFPTLSHPPPRHPS